jgi:SAM-dependent methyltransferase
VDDARHAAQARSFDRAAGVYARARPSYPPAALDWLLPPEARRVLDLGAGTGKLTALLAGRGLDVVAVEPSDRMRAQLAGQLPQIPALAGSAEAIPLPDGAVDAVLVAQAWHWVDPGRAVPEVARVLRPGGRLGLVWNRRDERQPWVAAFTAILAGGAGPSADADRPEIGPPFGAPERFDTPVWHHELTPEGLVELAASRSYIITLEEPERLRLLDRVRELAAHHPDLVGRPAFAMPYFTECVRADLEDSLTPAGSG